MQREPLANEVAINGIASRLHKGKDEHIVTSNGKLGKHVVDPAFKSLPLSDLILDSFASGFHICGKSLQSSFKPRQSSEHNSFHDKFWFNLRR